ncbi:DUF2142 domain-containing protein [Bifidobacterium oedipodis]|uniref:DUF2142 domain-containing protein n=1 Tax=Bifidobacterium oedipodis TaxID=2675322 RepID=A0A7Y0ERC8_9BIFI|nr:DUF2142 domain-containing protein [Bifidobacterium sp. DSM 109957]NMM95002.1 hypothetical protein [Bifidobacterium sp. DSM 109957]
MISAIVAGLVFLVLALAQSGLFIGRLGVFSIPDPDMHSSGTYALVSGQMFNRRQDRVDQYGNIIHEQYLKGTGAYLDVPADNAVVADLLTSVLLTNYDVSPPQARSVAWQRETLNMQKDKKIDGAYRSSQYSFMNYIPQAMGLKVGQATHRSPYGQWQMARIFNLAFYLIVMVAAIVVAPVGRPLIMALGLLPPSMLMASSIMCDPQFLALSVLFLAVLGRVAYNGDPMGRSSYAVMVLLVIWLAWGKTNYAAVSLLALVLPSRVLSWRRKAAAVAVSGVAFVPWLYWHGNFSALNYMASKADNDGVGMLRKLVTNTYNTIMLYRFGCLDIISLACTMAVLLVFVYCMAGRVAASGIGRMDEEPRTLTGRVRVFLSDNRYAVTAVAVAFMESFIASWFVLTTWNEIPDMGTFGLIRGFQGRYMLPIAALLLMPVLDKAIRERPE